MPNTSVNGIRLYVSFCTTIIMPEYNLRSTYAIAFLNFNAEAITEISGRYHLHYRTIEMECKNKLPSSPEYHFFDLKEFARIFRKSSGEITNATDYWLYLLTGSKEMDGMPDWAEGDKAYEAYFEASAVSNFTPQETLKYDKDMMTERDRINSINYAKQEGREEGREEGLMEGELKGREEGLQEGERKGREEGLQEGERKGREEERLSNAVNFLRAGVPAETVANATGLSLDTVQGLAPKV
jgi:hypothetical protein